MSNTDGEDIQRIEGFNPGDKAYILTEEQYIKFEKQNDVIADLKFKLKNDAIFQEYSDLEKQLASIREQLNALKELLSKVHKSLSTYGEHILIDQWVNKALSGHYVSIDEQNPHVYIKQANGKIIELQKQLQQKENENRELRKAVLHYFDTRNGWGHEGALDAMKAKDDLIQKAKNLSA